MLNYMIAVAVACSSLVAAYDPYAFGNSMLEILVVSDARTSICGTQHNVSGELIEKLKQTDQLDTIEPTLDIKCFTYCVQYNLKYYNENHEFDEEQVVKVNVAHGKDEIKTRAKIESCRHLFNRVHSCDQAYEAFLCFEKA